MQPSPVAQRAGCPISIVGAPATRVMNTVAAFGPCGLTFRRSSSGSTADPRFFTVRVPTSRSLSSAFSFLTLKGIRSVISYAVA